MKKLTESWRIAVEIAATCITVGGIIAVISYNNNRIDRIDPQVQRHEAQIAQMRSDLETNLRYIREGIDRIEENLKAHISETK